MLACATINLLAYTVYNLFFLAASECRSWILYYSIPVLEGILPSPYIDHYAKLVTSMHICFADQISSHDLLLVDDLLHQFYKDYEKLYGKFHFKFEMS